MLDDMDTRLLAALQKDAHLTSQQLGARLNLSPSQAGRRRQRLEVEGYIEGYTARLDPARLGLNVQGSDFPFRVLSRCIWAPTALTTPPASPVCSIPARRS